MGDVSRDWLAGKCSSEDRHKSLTSPCSFYRGLNASHWIVHCDHRDKLTVLVDPTLTVLKC